MKHYDLARPLLVCLLCTMVLSLIGCEIDSPSDVQRTVGANFTGFYEPSEGKSVIVDRNTGSAITTLDLRQGGDRLEAVDNNGIIFKGSIGAFSDNIASFEMVGRTTAGQEGTFSGQLILSGDSSGSTNEQSATTGQARMQGTWIEATLFSTFSAESTSVPGIIDPGDGGGGGGLSISPSSVSVAVGASQSFSVSGAEGNISWSLNSAVGSLSTFSGTSTTFTRSSLGQVTLTASDSEGGSVSAVIN